MIKMRNLDPSLRGLFNCNAPRRQRHVIKSDASNLDFVRSRSEGYIYNSIVDAVSEAEDYEDIIVWPGQYKELSTIAITQDSLRLLAAETGPFGRCLTRTEIRQYGNVDTPCISVEGAHNVEIGGFRITPYDPGTLGNIGINCGQTEDTYGLYIHNNYFYGVASSSLSVCHIQLGVDASFECDSAFIYRNDFYCGGASDNARGMLEWNQANRSQIRENNFWHIGNTADSIAINIYDAVLPRGGIFDNRFMNVEQNLAGSNAVAIKNPTVVGGDIQIDGNHFINYTSDACCIASRLNASLGVNYNNEAIIASAS